MTILILIDFSKVQVISQTCSNLKFPLTLGFSSGETEIFSVDQDNLTGYLFIGGTTTATEVKVSGATKSVFTAMFNGYDYIWIKVINNALVDTFEFMSAMGSSSQNLVLYATKSSLPLIPLIFTINKSDGSIIRAVDIDIASIGNVERPSKKNYRYSFMSARSPTEVFLCVNKPDNT